MSDLTVTFLGHAAVLIDCDETSIVFDPYDHEEWGGALGLEPIDVSAEWVVTTHSHADHAAIDCVEGQARDTDGAADVPFAVRRFSLPHDEYGGRRKGGHVDAVSISIGSKVITHLSDVGCSPVPQVVDAVRGCDVLLVPVGGHFTVGATQAWEWARRIAPAFVVPIHYRTAASKLPIRGVEEFIARSPWPVLEPAPYLTVGRRGEWHGEPTVALLVPRRARHA